MNYQGKQFLSKGTAPENICLVYWWLRRFWFYKTLGFVYAGHSCRVDTWLSWPTRQILHVPNPQMLKHDILVGKSPLKGWSIAVALLEPWIDEASMLRCLSPSHLTTITKQDGMSRLWNQALAGKTTLFEETHLVGSTSSASILGSREFETA